MDFSKNTSAGFLVNHMARLFAKTLQSNITDLGLTWGQFPILIELSEKDGRTQKELVTRLDLEQATVANTLNRMERDGLVRRVKDPSDGRAQQIWLTEKAKALRVPAQAAAKASNTQALAVLTPDEQTQLIALMKRVIDGFSDAR